jgi:hypothetical protein
MKCCLFLLLFRIFQDLLLIIVVEEVEEDIWDVVEWVGESFVVEEDR